MRKTHLLSLAVVLGLVGLCHADFNYVGRFVGVRVGPEGVSVRAPFVSVYVPKRCPPPLAVPLPPPAVPELPPVPEPPMPKVDPERKVPPPIPPQEREPQLRTVKLPAEAPSIYDFASSFKPTPGTHEVTVIHP